MAVLILVLTNHCWNSLKAERKPCSSSFSLLWHSLDAWRLRLETNQEDKIKMFYSTSNIYNEFVIHRFFVSDFVCLTTKEAFYLVYVYVLLY